MLVVMYNDLEQGTTLLRDRRGGLWTPRCLRRMMSHGFISGYDATFKDSYVVIPMELVSYAIIKAFKDEDAKKVADEVQVTVKNGSNSKDSMFQ